MIDETHLRGLLIEAAEAAPAPGRAPEDLLASLMADPGAADGGDGDGGDGGTPVTPFLRRRPNPRVLAVAAAVAVAVLAVGVGTGLGGDDTLSRDRTAATAFDETGTTGGTDGGDRGFVSTTVPGFAPTLDSGGGAGAATAAPAGDSSVDYGSVGALGPLPAPESVAQLEGDVASSAPAGAPLADSAKVVKTGSLDLQVKKGRFEGTVNAITTKATGLNGYVAESTTSRSGDAPTGTVVVRVPSESFDSLLADLRKLGKVQSVAQKGTEVSAEYTDTQARLAAVTATRDRLNVVLSKAENVPDILSVQDRITQVQTEIEQLQGQLRLLDDQVSMGTLAVSLSEPGATPVEIKEGDDRTVGSAWRDARHRFGNAIEGVVAWSGSAAAVLVIGLVGAVLATLVWRRSRRYFL